VKKCRLFAKLKRSFKRLSIFGRRGEVRIASLAEEIVATNWVIIGVIV
jgi:hypothetical protein